MNAPFDQAIGVTDPAGRLADLARLVVSETEAIYNDPEANPLVQQRATALQREAKHLAKVMDGYTEMPDAKRAREEAK